MDREEVVLLPQPSTVNWTDGELVLTRDDTITIEERDKDILVPIAETVREEVSEWCHLCPDLVVGTRGERRSAITFDPDSTVASEAYRLEITPDGITIEYSDRAGAFYGTRTLKQFFVQCGQTIPCVEIVDAPDFEQRGVMLDISRNKIPSMETLTRLIEFLGDLKLNHVQLYIEGYPFAYPSFPDVWRGGTPLTGEDILELSRVCEQCCIDLVPNQNSFGHMTDWLAEDAFADLAESPDGFELWDTHHPPSTLDPTNPETRDFLAETYDDLLPYFSDERFNVGCDETFELGEGRSADACAERGTGRVYLDHLLNVYELLDERDKQMMVWGDIINEYPELVSELPADVIVLEWGYEADHPFDEHAHQYADAGLPFYVCPGTSSWNSLTGRTKNMRQNLRNAAENGLEHGARGYLITDWGDNGHWQPLPVSYPGYVYGAALAWGVEENSDPPIASFLDRFRFRDDSETMGQLLLDLGNYYLKEDQRASNATNVFRILNTAMDASAGIDNVSKASLTAIDAYVSDLEDALSRAEMACDDAAVIEKELSTAIRMVQHGTRLGRLQLHDRDSEEFNALLAQNRDEIETIISDFRQCWLARNRHSDLDESLAHLQQLRETYDTIATEIE